ncbi:nucleotidyltransferase [Flavobacterium zepuense]|uniref:Nucleotidyltransferase n=1 Tax=Flavobacterium zepuense TaxID=2593302 RepID=A0A552UVE3_9FLAO|nr:nucleotidyltransferase [Flavobacterium zepuense]TRW22130.1 nucleotidyltransferase [Flavobacterium zepuense]
MASTVNSAFSDFNKNTVNLEKNNTDNARSSRDWLLSQLNSFPNKVENFPLDYPDKHIKYGSFARNTKIKPLDDIDLMYCLHGSGGYYQIDFYNRNTYYIHTENSSENLQKLSDQNKLNSIKVVNKFVKSLSNVPQYSNSSVKRNQEAAVLNLISYDWCFDIVPCFFTTEGLYLIPDGVGNWKATNPLIDNENVKSINSNYNGKVLQLIRVLKYWNVNSLSPKLGSYFFEIIVLNFVKSKVELPSFIDFAIRDFFDYLSLHIYYDVFDPKGIQGNINDLTYDQKVKISNKAKSCLEIANDAIYQETSLKNQKKAIENWCKIFGDKFPTYE